MKLEWMGEYRDVVESVIGFANAYSQVVNIEVFGDEVRLTPAQLQVLEYILETEDLNQNMSQIAARLSISQSNFSKMTKQLVKKGMLEKYHTKNNCKNVIIRVSELGKKFYEDYSSGAETDIWRDIFEKLECVSEKDRQLFVECMHMLSSQMSNPTPITHSKAEELVRIE